MFWAAYCMISRPVVVSPVNATLATRLLDASGFPASTPKPLTTLSTPGGSRSPITSSSTWMETGVCSAGLSTTALPAASAGASFQTAMRIGKFHGMIWATTPSGSWKWYATVFSSSSPMEPSCERSTPAKYRKWSIASGMSAASVSRTGLPLSQVSATASASRCCSIRSAMRSRMFDRSVGEVRPHPGAAPCAASRARSTSSAVPRATSVNVWPVTGVALSKYRPPAGGTYCPPMK